MKQALPFLLFIILFPVLLQADMWASREIDCPLCGTKNKFSAVLSFGSYVYNSPSKYEQVFFPYTDPRSVYTCKLCRYSAFMRNFKSLPSDKHEIVKKLLEDVDFETAERYFKIPMSKRLQIVEMIGEKLDTDDSWWCWFYRVKGYHLDREGRSEDAVAARKRALEIVHKFLDRKELKHLRKDHLFLRGAMYHYTGQYKMAIMDFREAEPMDFKYVSDEDLEKMSEEDRGDMLKRSRKKREYLDALIKESLQRSLEMMEEDS